MKWYNAGDEKLPADGEIVLISINGVELKAIFSEKFNAFITPNNTFFPVGNNGLYWRKLSVKQGSE